MNVSDDLSFMLGAVAPSKLKLRPGGSWDSHDPLPAMSQWDNLIDGITSYT